MRLLAIHTDIRSKELGYAVKVKSCKYLKRSMIIIDDNNYIKNI